MMKLNLALLALLAVSVVAQGNDCTDDICPFIVGVVTWLGGDISFGDCVGTCANCLNPGQGIKKGEHCGCKLLKEFVEVVNPDETINLGQCIKTFSD
jgi:hypothetical protein